VVSLALDNILKKGLAAKRPTSVAIAFGALVTCTLVSCSSKTDEVTSCALARSPKSFVGRPVSITDTIVEEGLSGGLLVPDPDCSSFVYFEIELRLRKAADREKLITILARLQALTVHGETAGLRGRYVVRIERQSAPAVWTMSIMSADNLQIVPGTTKFASLHAQLPKELQ
jgi:hypothetical protein